MDLLFSVLSVITFLTLYSLLYFLHTCLYFLPTALTRLAVRSRETDYAYSYRGEISGQVAAGTLSARLPRRPGSSSLCSFRRQEAAEKASLVLHSGERAV